MNIISSILLFMIIFIIIFISNTCTIIFINLKSTNGYLFSRFCQKLIDLHSQTKHIRRQVKGNTMHKITEQ